MSLDLAYDDANLFAKILRGEIPAAKVMEDEATLAFMDVFPQSHGHTLIIPKRARAVHFLDLPEDEIAPLMSAAQRVGKALRAALQPEGLTLMQFSGAAGGQSVFHLHVHLIPRWADQPLKGHGSAPRADFAQLQALAVKIAAHL